MTTALSETLTDLTERQREIYLFIKRKVDSGRTPSVREICARFNIHSTNGVFCHLQALERKGKIIRPRQQPRAIQIVESR